MDEEKTINTEETQGGTAPGEQGTTRSDGDTTRNDEAGTTRSDNTGASQSNAEDKAGRTAGGGPAPDERHFTQAEVDEIVRRRMARSAKDTAAVTAENTALRHSVACYKAGIKAESVEDAVVLASRLVDDKTDFDAALAKVLEKYPDFGSTPQVKNTSVDMTAKKNDQSLSALRESMGLSARK